MPWFQICAKEAVDIWWMSINGQWGLGRAFVSLKEEQGPTNHKPVISTGWPKSLFGFSIRCLKSEWLFLANAINGQPLPECITQDAKNLPRGSHLASRHRSRLSFYFLLKIRQSRHVQEEGSRAVSSWPGEFTGWGPDSRLLIGEGHEPASESHPPLPRKPYVYHPQRSPILMREESTIKLCHFDIGGSV